MRVLLIKMSSIGDIIHTFPAVTDAAHAIPGLQVDWVVEDGMQEMPAWHPAVDRVVPVGLRRWRRNPLKTLVSGAPASWRQALRQTPYDAVIDAQGLYKSAMIAGLARGPRHGFDMASAREPMAALTHRHRHRVPKGQHAVWRLRRLFAAALGYDEPSTPADYGLNPLAFVRNGEEGRHIAFLHGTAWRTKRWTVDRWRGLAQLAGEAGLAVTLPWHAEEDRKRAARIADGFAHVRPVRTDSLTAAGALIRGAAAAVAVDTGLGHLAAALGVPTVSLYGPTATRLTGTVGERQDHFASDKPCAPCRNRICTMTGNLRAPPPCLEEMTERQVWARLVVLNGQLSLGSGRSVG